MLCLLSSDTILIADASYGDTGEQANATLTGVTLSTGDIISFRYQIRNSQDSLFEMRIYDAQNMQQLGSWKHNIPFSVNTWIDACVPSSWNKASSLVFTVAKGSDFSGFVAVDYVTINKGETCEGEYSF